MNNASLAKLVSSKIKRVHKGAICRVNYVGTGSKANRRQLFVRLPNGFALDLWFEEDHVALGGVIRPCSGPVPRLGHASFTSDGDIADAVVRVLGSLSVPSL